MGKIVVSPEPADAKKGAEPLKEAAKKLEGKVLVVNKDYRFAVINLGSKDGVVTGMIFPSCMAARILARLKSRRSTILCPQPVLCRQN